MQNLAEEVLERALGVALAGDEALCEALDRLPAPVYITDAEGVVTYFNLACLDFTGRRPEVGKDRWCVTWRLYTTAGEPLPHDRCPMAVSINSRQPIRGVTAIAERPDGVRVTFRPYPTPIFDRTGNFVGAVNVLEDVTDELRAKHFLAQASRCRRLALAVNDDVTIDTLNQMADEYESKAEALQAALRARWD